MPDTRKAPAQGQAGNQGGASEPDPNSLEGLAARFDQFQGIVQDLDTRNRNLQAWTTRVSQENKRLRDQINNAGGRRRRASGYDDPEDSEYDEEQPSERPRSQTLSRLEQRLLDEKRRRVQSDSRRGFSDYRMNNPDWKEHHKDVMKIVNDEGRVGEYANFTGEMDEETGLPILDVEKTYANVLRAVKIAKYEAAKAAAGTGATAEEESDKNKNRAAISGSDAAGGGDEGKIVISEDMTSDEMIEKGLVKFKGQAPEKLGIK